MFDSVNIGEFISSKYCPQELINSMGQYSEDQIKTMYSAATNILKEYRDTSTPKPKKSNSVLSLNNSNSGLFTKYINSFIEQYTILLRIQSGKKSGA